MKLLIIFSMMCSSLVASAQTDLYEQMESKFQQATQPVIENMQSGWFSGRCLTRREPQIEKSGVLVFSPASEGTGLKQIIPLGSLRDEASFFDELTAEEYEIYSEELYEKDNAPVIYKNNSLVSELYYGILIGTIHTRLLGNELIVAFTNYDDVPTATRNAHFYCQISKKVHD